MSDTSNLIPVGSSAQTPGALGEVGAQGGSRRALTGHSVLLWMVAVAAIITIGCLGANLLLRVESTPNKVSQKWSGGSLALAGLQEEFSALRKRLKIIERALPAKAEEVASAQKDLAALETRLQQITMRLEKEQSLMDTRLEMAAQNSEAMTSMIEFLGLLFAMVLFGVTLLTGLNIRNLNEELERHKKQMKEQVSEFTNDAQQGKASHLGKIAQKQEEAISSISNYLVSAKFELDVQANTVIESVKEARRREADLERYLSHLAETHSGAFAEILGSMPLKRILSEDEARSLRRKGQELKGRLLLLHPGRESRDTAIRHLVGVGTKISIADLRRLQKDPETDKEMALLIESAIKKIEERLKASEVARITNKVD